MAFRLYMVCGHERKGNLVALLPGVPQQVIVDNRLGEVRQGDRIDLIRPDGSRLLASIYDYYIRFSIRPSADFDITNAPIVLCLSPEFSEEQIPIGTFVELSSGAHED